MQFCSATYRPQLWWSTGLFYPAIFFYFLQVPHPGARPGLHKKATAAWRLTGVQHRSLPCFGAEQDSYGRVVGESRCSGFIKRGVRTYVCVRAYPLRLEHAGFNATWAGACIPDARSLALGLALINGRAGQAANHRHPTQPLYNFRCSAAGSERIASDHFQILTKIKKGACFKFSARAVIGPFPFHWPQNGKPLVHRSSIIVYFGTKAEQMFRPASKRRTS